MKKAVALIFSFALLWAWAVYVPKVLSWCELFNSLIHFWGGALVVFSMVVSFSCIKAVWNFFFPGRRWSGLEGVDIFTRFLLLLFGSLFGGYVWELWEFWHFGEGVLASWTCLTMYADTIKDLGMDLAGGFSAAVIYELIRKD